MKVYCVLVVNMDNPTLSYIDSVWRFKIMAEDRWATKRLLPHEGATIVEQDLK